MNAQTKIPIDPEMLRFIQSDGEYHEDDEANLGVSICREGISNPLMKKALEFAGGALAMMLIAIARLV